MIQKLSATKVKQARPKSKTFKLFDGNGLYLLVHTNGSKYWRYDYQFTHKRKTLALGIYPSISLADARTAHQNARELLKNGIDPSHNKRLEKLTRNIAASDTFKAIAEEWFIQKQGESSKRNQSRTLAILEKDLFPYIGDIAISQIKPLEILTAIRKIEQRGSTDLPQRARQITGQIFRYAIITNRAQIDPSRDLVGALKATPTVRHNPTITDPEQLSYLLRAIDSYKATIVVNAALKISILLFQRPGEIRHMEWSEINWQESRWELPGAKMKMGLDHIVPLSKQAVSVLEELHMHTGRGKYVFPSARGASRPLSENGVRTALRTMGYSNEQITPHGFRAMARTILDEVLGYRVDWIEHQLAHAVKDPNGRAYNRTAHLEGRRKMMQGWADYLDKVKNG